MKLYNTLTRKIEPLQPLAAPKATVYTCGPTVYDYPHIGNWFTFIRYDLLVRTLKLSGYEPIWVMNITDVGHLVSDADEGEDKLEKGAKREGKSAWDVAKFYTDYFTHGLERLNFTKPTYLPKATDHIPEQIKLIQTLEDKGYTYKISDGIYYDTSKFSRYADFARLDLDEQQAGARVEINPEKRNQTDFALWKFSPTGSKRDMEWDSPWGKGFPGWHLECSAMAMKYLGETIDIHSGGIDHVPVHHTNEIAQSEAATDKPLAHIWMHSNHVSVEGEKIAKSLGNSITLEDIEAKGYSPLVLRLHVLESHYRSQSKFSWDSLEAAKNRLNNWQEFAVLRWQLPQPNASFFEFDYFEEAIVDHLQDDLNTPQALRTIDAAIANIYKDLAAGGAGIGFDDFNHFLQTIDRALGLTLSQTQDVSDSIKAMIQEREVARQDKDWVKSDEIRKLLAKQGIGLRDTDQGAIWFRQ